MENLTLLPIPTVKSIVNKWFARSMDMMKSYEPDLLWFDLGFSNPEYEEKRKSLACPILQPGR
ncbi:hypothetical protein P4S73_17455 [Paraglaciecola sp. Hal342]